MKTTARLLQPTAAGMYASVNCFLVRLLPSPSSSASQVFCLWNLLKIMHHDDAELNGKGGEQTQNEITKTRSESIFA